MLGYLRVSLFATFLLCMSGCGRTWNPDEQFQNQVDQISFQREMSVTTKFGRGPEEYFPV